MIAHFPPELLSHIAWHVSGLSSYDSEEDRNQNVNAIFAFCQVNKYFYEVAFPYLFRRVRVCDARKVLALDGALRRHRVVVRHLCLVPTAQPQQGGGGATSNQELGKALVRIVSYTAPTLYSLSLDLSNCLQESPVVLSRVFRTGFPELEYLSLGGFYPNPTGTADRFPKVRTLHLAGNRNPHGLLQLGCVANTFPRLGRLKISGLSMAVSFALELEEAVGDAVPRPSALSLLPPPPPTLLSNSTTFRYYTSIWRRMRRDDELGEGGWNEEDDEDEEGVRMLPHTLTHLDIQPAPSTSVPPISANNANVTASLKDAAMMDRLRSIAESFSSVRGDGEEKEGRLRFRLLDREGRQGLEEEWREWVGRGGERI
ncbi:hypothetical protein MD484_g7960, partial [Candolleomyces efflorescens]